MPGPLKSCKGCGSTTRKLSAPGPRCASCHREVKAARKAAAHARWIEKTYGITAEDYQALYEAQGGACYICQRAKGISKKLSVDHDHATGYVRGLLCTSCNKFLGLIRDNPWAGLRINEYLRFPPAFKTIGRKKPSE
jgi:hypothetical protein